MAKINLIPKQTEQVYLSPKSSLNKIYIYIYKDGKLWRKFFPQVPQQKKTNYNYLKTIIKNA